MGNRYYDNKSGNYRDDYPTNANYIEAERQIVINSILALDKRFTREYLASKTTDTLHDLEDALLDQTYETL
jgi:hypothetical protein